jgi:UDP-N-acetylmuramate dehydrogenase
MPINEKEWWESFQGTYRGETLFDVPMTHYTSLAIGGPADVLVIPEDPLSVKNLLVVLGKKRLPFITVGGGTNLLVRDKGIEGIVILLRAFRRIEVLKERNTEAELFVESGVPWQKLVNFCKDKGYSGLEGLTGIPGTVGGAIWGNAGSFGYEAKDTVESVAIMDASGKLDRFKAEDLGFGYRKSEIAPNDIVLSANLLMKREDRDIVAKRTEGFFAEKKRKQPISERSAGCVFRNPEGAAAGRLIDESGCKGMRVGGIEVSGIHANFFLNRDGGTASDFLALMDRVSSSVLENTGVALEPEIKVVGRE